MGLITQGRLAGQPTSSGDVPFSLPHHWDFRELPPHLGFYVSARDQTQVLRLAGQRFINCVSPRPSYLSIHSRDIDLSDVYNFCDSVGKLMCAHKIYGM